MKNNQDKKNHDNRVNNIQEIAEQYYRDEIGEIPPLNKDFMEIDKEHMRKPIGAARYLPIAATIVIVFIIGNIVAAAILDDPEYGDKGLLYRIYQSMKD